MGRIKHGYSTKPEFRLTYNSWAGMVGRARAGTRSKDPRVNKYYRDRGIFVCERWEDFRNFLADMGQRPGPEYSIERINNDKGYYPENCKWATDKEQANNKTTTMREDPEMVELLRRYRLR